MAANAAKVGIKLELEQMADANLFTRGRNARIRGLQLVGWGAGYPDADSMVSRHAVEPGQAARGQAGAISELAVTGVVQDQVHQREGRPAARMEPDPAKRIAMYREHPGVHDAQRPDGLHLPDIRPIADPQAEVKGFVISPFARRLRHGHVEVAAPLRDPPLG